MKHLKLGNKNFIRGASVMAVPIIVIGVVSVYQSS